MSNQNIPAPAIDGFSKWKLESWNEYINLFITGPLENTKEFIFRGQQKECWELTSSLNRLVGKANKNRLNACGIGSLRYVNSNNEDIPCLEENNSPSDLSGINHNVINELIEGHYENFKRSIRGRVSTFELQSLLNDEDELLALGQHYGLATPFLDWTTSPFIAAFFAFEDACNDCNNKVIYALDKNAMARIGSDEDDRVKIIRPQLGENKRLISQNGLFVSIPRGTNLEEWVKRRFAGSVEHILIKISIPSGNRHEILRYLNKYNINHLSLYPDVIGSSKYCNLHFEIDNY